MMTYRGMLNHQSILWTMDVMPGTLVPRWSLQHAQTVEATKADTVHGFYDHFRIQFVSASV